MSATRSSTSSGPDARLAILGGSSAFMPCLADVLATRAASLPALEVSLHGRDAERTQIIARYCQGLAHHRGLAHRYQATTDLDTAVRGATIVVNMIRVGGWQGRHHDETFPVAFGYPGDETIGPGGLASALRTVPVVQRMAEQVARVNPAAWFVNMTNPMSILIAALRTVPGLKCLGLCELPAVTLDTALRVLGEAPATVAAQYLGVNHQGWFVSLRRRDEDLLPRLLARLAASEADGSFFRVDIDVMQELRALPLPYLRFYYHTAREVEALRERRVSRAHVLERLSRDLYSAYAAGFTGALPDAVGQRSMPWFELVLVPAISALLGGPPAQLFVSQRNAGSVRGLPDDAIVEQCCRVDARGAQPVAATLPPRTDLLAFLARVVAFEQLAAAAALAPSDESILRALVQHPFAIPRDRARAMLPCLRASIG